MTSNQKLGTFLLNKFVFDTNKIENSFNKAHQGQIGLNKILGTVKGTHQTSKWTPLGSQITEN